MINGKCFSLRILDTELQRVGMMLYCCGYVDTAIAAAVRSAVLEGIDLLDKYNGHHSTGDDVHLLIQELKFYR